MRMLEFKIREPRYWCSIKTMLLYLGYIEETWKPEIPLENELVERLRGL